MQSRQVHAADGQRTYVLVLGKGDEIMQAVKAFAEAHALHGSRFTAIGAFERATLAFFDWERKEYERIPVDEQVEVLALVGDIAEKDGAPALHAHVVVGKRDGTAHGGHLMEGWVRPTLEVVLVETPAQLRRRHDPETGLSLIRFD